MGSVYGGGKDDPFDRTHELAKMYTQRGDEKIQDALETLAVNGIYPQAWVSEHAIGEPEKDPQYGQAPEHEQMVNDKVSAGVGWQMQNMRDLADYGVPVPVEDGGYDEGGYEGE